MTVPVFKKLKAVTPSLRNTVESHRTFLWTGKPIKKHTVGLHKTGGRNHSGKITTFHRGGGHKKRYRSIKPIRTYTFYGFVHSIEHDPFRSAFIFACVQPGTGGTLYLLAPQNISVGDLIYSGPSPKRCTIGSYLPLKGIPVGSLVYNLELIKGEGSKYIRAAGTFGKFIKKNTTTNEGEIILPSGERRLCELDCYASVGAASNQEKKFRKLGKAGRNRWYGKKPTVRGIAMNPCDHPHGGGNGVSTSKKGCRTPWGKVTKGQPTRNKKKINIFILKSRKQQ